MKLLTCALTVSLALASTANAEVQVSMNNGLVTIVAKDATVRQIIAEWARVGQAKVVNAERIPGGPMTIELKDVPEAQALDTLLRSAAGYLAAPRAIATANLSHFDRIVVMPISSAPRTAASQPTAVFQPPQQFIPQPAVAIADDQQDDERPVNVPAPGGAPNARGPVFNAFPQPQVVNPQVINPQTGAPVQLPFNPYTTTQTTQGQVPVSTTPVQQPVYSSTPTAPFGGVAVPGMVAPPPNQPGVAPGQIAPPGQTRRPGGQ